MRSLALNTILVFSFLQGIAQDYRYGYDNSDLRSKRIAGYMSIRNDLNIDDYILGTELGIVSKSRRLTAFATFDARPYRKRILEYRGNNMFYQFREERFFLGAGAEYFKSFKQLPLAAFVQANGVYTWGKYGGTEMKPDQGWVIIPRLGLALDLRGYGWLKLGYSYLDPKSYRLEKHRVYIAISGFLSNNP
ncbi:MAG: hypothetical protein CMB80_08660 [Flammeovirgaceae bacterium]|nr:hypothetical protein [Flammeovirgaceae bacterium]MBE62338.1 hypothetical protein [Flammeovirgaceae bacterium]MBR06279.1 hypothetical protein [Rickettsiales bacterium]|tara:strand:- start:284 stop:856 length:573 start_codon:yes stop_codon:yes gene_type:complete